MSELNPANRGLEFFHHAPDKNQPTISGRDIRYVPTCKMCNIVNNLVNDYGYDWDEAVRVESDVYRMIYFMWSASDIARWLNENVQYDIKHDSVSRHMNRHIPDPTIAFYERIRAYGAGNTQKKFIKEMAETMRLTATQFRNDVISGATEIKPGDFVKIFETLREWDEISESSEQKIFTAVHNTINAVLEDETLKAKFEYQFREELERLEDLDE